MNRSPIGVALLGSSIVFLGFCVRLLGTRGTDLGLDGGLSLALAILPRRRWQIGSA